MVNWLVKIAGVSILAGILGCQPEDIEDPDGYPTDTIFGIVEFDFPVSSERVPLREIHRLDLSIASTSYDLYREDFLISANVSDLVATYSFHLLPGEYYFRAGIICTCLGDTCLWDGFPGGRLGTKWMFGKIDIVKSKKVTKRIVFTK